MFVTWLFYVYLVCLLYSFPVSGVYLRRVSFVEFTRSEVSVSNFPASVSSACRAVWRVSRTFWSLSGLSLTVLVVSVLPLLFCVSGALFVTPGL